MTHGLWLSAAGMQINEYRQAIESNNLANVDTVGFKEDFALIRQRRLAHTQSPAAFRFRHPALDGIAAGNWVQPTLHSFAQGDLRPSDNPLDAAIEGEGFFTVSDGNAIRYTRDGRFTRNTADEMVMTAGDGQYRVLDEAGAPVTLLPDGEQPRILNDGRVMQGSVEVGRIAMVEFADRNALRKVGGNLFTATSGAAAHPAIQSRIHGGFTEASTVNPTESLASMIEVSRAFELNASLLSLQDQTLSRAVNSVGRVA